MRISGPSLKFTAASLNDLLSGLMGDRTLHAHWKPCENLNLLYKHIDFFPSTERKDWCARWKHKRPLINLVSLCDRTLYSRLFFFGCRWEERAMHEAGVWLSDSFTCFNTSHRRVVWFCAAHAFRPSACVSIKRGSSEARVSAHLHKQTLPRVDVTASVWFSPTAATPT